MKRKGNEIPATFILGGFTLIGSGMQLGWAAVMAGFAMVYAG
ncbi:hypothetical protein [Halorussus lipolyticus]|nr:hypothetical protein [Halorussus sp. DT80]